MKKLLISVSALAIIIVAGKYIPPKFEENPLSELGPFSWIQDLTEKQTDFYNNKINFGDRSLLVLNFWATWCPPCVEETPSLLKFIDRNREKMFLLSISNDSNKSDVDKFIKTLPLFFRDNVAIVHDASQVWGKKVAVEQLPETFIVSLKNGKYIQFSGAVDWNNDEILQKIKALETN